MDAKAKLGQEMAARGHLRLKVLAASAAMVMLGMGALPASAGEYLLGPQDKVRLKIYEWRASRDSIFEWTALNDQFTVGADGNMSLPFVGSINAAGTAPGALGASIGRLLMERMGLGRAPDVAVEVVQFRPFYVVGQVKNAGEFPYRPGLTVLQALSIAGGLQTREERTDRLEREVISGRGDLNLLALAGTNLLARKARLQAELANADDIAFPEALTRRAGESAVALAMEQEKLVFTARKDGMRTQLQALNGLKEFLQKEQTSLEAQLALYDEQIELVKKELTGVSTLVDKGLSAAPREIALERALAQVRSDRLAAETAVFRARQEISRTDVSILDVSNRHTTEVSESLRETQAQMNEVSRKADTAMQMLRDSEITAPRLLAMRNRNEEAEPIYVLMRTTPEGKSTEIPATEATQIEPGDTVKIKIPLPKLDEGGLSLLSESQEPGLPLASQPDDPATGLDPEQMATTSSTQ
ncbi:polysaccharide biosynthesis/export family protein [Aminobacter sp. HY435]|uniref:polysaccharide biosynthesis/export family protein n=1 Tax=Aminobacter sp. HY435 TaxID=2970917 RepID=UPI0022B9A085|nr:polysaccharide biosynthesis/export family protein [Aminobacter sp. HY435]